MIGGGFIGLEAASSLQKMGKNVTVLEFGPRLVGRAVGEETADYFLQAHRSRGLDIRLATSAARLTADKRGTRRGRRGAPRRHRPPGTDRPDRHRRHPQHPTGRTTRPGRWTTGSWWTASRWPRTAPRWRSATAPTCPTRYPASAPDERIRLESVNNAIEHAKVAAYSLTGRREEYAGIPWFWSNQADLKLQIAGLCNGYDQTVLRRDEERGKFSVLYYRAGPGSSPPTASTRRWTSWPSRTRWPRARTSLPTLRRTRRRPSRQSPRTADPVGRTRRSIMNTPETPVDLDAGTPTRLPEATATRCPAARAFVADYPARPFRPRARSTLPRSPPLRLPWTNSTRLWRAVVHETRTRGNDIHLPISLAFAERLCRAYPDADAELVRVGRRSLHDTGWAHVDESRIISEGFSGDWRKAAIRYEHEKQGCDVARRVLPPTGLHREFIERVCDIIDGHDTRPVAHSLEDALMRDADRLWRLRPGGDCAGLLLVRDGSCHLHRPAGHGNRAGTHHPGRPGHGRRGPGPFQRPAQDGGDPMTAATHDCAGPRGTGRARTCRTPTWTTIFINGAWMPARGTGRNPVTDPATGEVWGSVPDGNARGRGRRRRLRPQALSTRPSGRG